MQTETKIEQILKAIRETISGGVEFAEDKLSQVLELLTSSKLTAEEKIERTYASASSALVHAVSSASSYAVYNGASATSAASVASVSAVCVHLPHSS